MKKYLFFFIALSWFSASTAQITDTTKKSTADQSLFGNKIFSVVENPPRFPGGYDSLKRYFSKNIVYPQQLLENHIGGMVILTFIVEKDGSLSSVKAYRSPDEKFSEEAIRVMRSVKYINAMQDGYPARIAYEVKISFDPDNPQKH